MLERMLEVSIMFFLILVNVVGFVYFCKVFVKKKEGFV